MCATAAAGAALSEDPMRNSRTGSLFISLFLLVALTAVVGCATDKAAPIAEGPTIQTFGQLQSALITSPVTGEPLEGTLDDDCKALGFGEDNIFFAPRLAWVTYNGKKIRACAISLKFGFPGSDGCQIADPLQSSTDIKCPALTLCTTDKGCGKDAADVSGKCMGLVSLAGQGVCNYPGALCTSPDKGVCAGTGTQVWNGASFDCNAQTKYKAGQFAEVCDGLDNNCDGKIDENFPTLGQACDGADTDLCKNGKLQCSADTLSVVCGAETISNIVNVCDGLDNNCDGKIDELFVDLGVACNVGIGACNQIGKKQCTSDTKATECSVGAAAPKAEFCNDVDDNCDGKVDEGCDKDADGYCDSALNVIGKPAACPKGPGDCSDDPKIKNNANLFNPGATEMCDGLDNNCDGKIDEPFAKLTLVCSKGLGACKAAGVYVCSGDGTDVACNAKDIAPIAEICDGALDENCDGKIDEGCDADADGYCAVGMTLAKDLSKVCAKGGGDCAANDLGVNPGAVEICNDKDDNCDGNIDEGCDDDGDKYCDATMVVVGIPKICLLTTSGPKTGKGDDCDDTTNKANPGLLEVCGDGIDNNCNGVKDEAAACQPGAPAAGITLKCNVKDQVVDFAGQVGLANSVEFWQFPGTLVSKPTQWDFGGSERVAAISGLTKGKAYQVYLSFAPDSVEKSYLQVMVAAVATGTKGPDAASKNGGALDTMSAFMPKLGLIGKTYFVDYDYTEGVGGTSDSVWIDTRATAKSVKLLVYVWCEL